MAPPSPDLSIFNSTSSLLSLLDLNDDHRRHHHHLSMQNMENMDIDLVTVLDTPDRLSTQKINKGINSVEDTRGLSVAGNSGISDVFDKGGQNFLGRGRSNTDNPNPKRLFSRTRGDNRFHGETQENGQQVVDLVSPTPPKHANLSKRVMSENFSSRHFTDRVASSNDRAKLDGDNLSLAELIAGDNKKHGKNEEKRNDKTLCKSKEKMDDEISLLEMPSNAPCMGGRDLKKKTLREGNLSSDIDDHSRISAAMRADHGKGILLNNGKLNTESMSRPLQSTPLQRKQGQRKLVRNGCIAPHNTAKAKCNNESREKSYEDGKRGVVEDMVHNFRASSSPMNIVTPVSGSNDTERVKGKGIMVERSAQKDVDESSHLSSRISPNRTETIIVDTGKDAISTFGGMDGWRSTHTRSNSASSTLCGGAGQLARTNERAGCSHETGDVVLLQRGPTSSSAQAQPSSAYRSEVDKKGGQHCGSIQMARGQRKRGSSFSNGGESSTSVADDSEILLWSSKEPINARSTRSRSGCHRGNLSGVIQIDDMSPGIQVGGSQNTSQSNDESNARARQLEADEALARELQEQFYHELPVAGSGEVDADIAWSLQHEEEAQRASSLRRQRVHPRDASMAHLYRHNHAQALQDSSIRSTSRANRGRGRGRGPTSARMPRLRDRVLGNSTTTSSRGRGIHRSIQFRPNVDVEMRIHILEALEAAAGATEHMMPSNFFQLQRDFTEDDYEMLLALDENNHQHGGANPVQINGLPESKVQVGTVVEDCAVCLETPTIGDAIRHLPCLHKFHKECIDPWLRRKTSCPICKSGIT